jgi:hypothetical protein
VAGSALVGIGLNKSIQFRKSREQLILRELAATGHLPVSVSRRLKGNFLPVSGNNGWPKLLPPDAVASVPALVVPTDSGLTAPVPAPVIVDSRAPADSLDALLGLFMAKRFAGQLPALLLTGVGSAMTRATGADREYNYITGKFEEQEPSSGAVVAGLSLALGGVVYMYIHNAPYSMANFEALKVAYEGGAPLPAKLRGQIKPKHFTTGQEWRIKLARMAARKKARRNK